MTDNGERKPIQVNLDDSQQVAALAMRVANSMQKRALDINALLDDVDGGKAELTPKDLLYALRDCVDGISWALIACASIHRANARRIQTADFSLPKLTRSH